MMNMIFHLLLLATSVSPGKSTSDVEFEQDFVHSFLIKAEKLKKTERLTNAERNWLRKTKYKNAVGISIENWTNHKLEFPDFDIEDGSSDRWYNPVDIPRHMRDIGLLAYSKGAGRSGNKGTISYLVEDSWPRNFISLGWNLKGTEVEVVISVADRHMNYQELLDKELNGLLMKDGMRFYKGTSHYVVTVTCRQEGPGKHLVLSVVPQNMDVWSWEKYYKQKGPEQAVSVQKVDLEISPTESIVARPRNEYELEDEPPIFERKELLARGESVLTWQGNKTERQVIASVGKSVACGLRIENWSQHTLNEPKVKFNYGIESDQLPVTTVGPGYIELAILLQKRTATGVSAVIHWNISDTDTVLSLMISVPYNQHLWSSWVAAGLTKSNSVPDFNAMYSGTPDSSWFVRQKMGRKMEFTNGELILVVESDSGTSKPIVRLGVVPLKPSKIAHRVKLRLEGKDVDVRVGKEGEQSMMALSSSSAAQCHCPCMGSQGGISNNLCRIILTLALFLHIKNVGEITKMIVGQY